MARKRRTQQKCRPSRARHKESRGELALDEVIWVNSFPPQGSPGALLLLDPRRLEGVARSCFNHDIETIENELDTLDLIQSNELNIKSSVEDYSS